MCLSRAVSTYVGAEVVEEELAAGGATDVYSAGEGEGLGLVDFAILEVREFLLKVANVVGDVELGGAVSSRCGRL